MFVPWGYIHYAELGSRLIVSALVLQGTGEGALRVFVLHLHFLSLVAKGEGKEQGNGAFPTTALRGCDKDSFHLGHLEVSPGAILGAGVGILGEGVEGLVA